MAKVLKVPAAVGYVRVSMDSQELSPIEQRRMIQAWTSAKGLELVEIVEDLGVRSWVPLDERPGFVRALELVQTRTDVVVLVAADTDRFGRLPEILSDLRRRVGRAGARVVGLELPDFDGSGSPEDAFMRHVLDGLPFFQLLKIRSTTKKALAGRKSEGKLVGSVPYGWRLTPRDAQRRLQGLKSLDPLVEDMAEQAALARARELRAGKAGYRAIATQLRVEGFRPRGKEWYPMSVKRMLAVAEALDDASSRRVAKGR